GNVADIDRDPASQVSFKRSHHLSRFYITIAQSLRRLRKINGIRRLAESDIPPAKAQRRQLRNCCHFDRREKSS
ncbi:MAG: hypothetical protein ACXW6T_17485, partial [Candidatus Binatia bacterium]